MQTIIFAGGGTLGHVMPALSVINVLKSSYNIIFITDEKCKKIIPDEIETYVINVHGISRKISLRNIISLVEYLFAKVKVEKLIKKLKPDLVIGMGGYVSAPVIAAAIKCKIKTAIHEQNSIMGLVNKYFQAKVDKVLVSFPQQNIGIVVGNPRMTDYYERYLKTKKAEKTTDVLFVGGSGGARRINDFVVGNQKEFERKKYKVKLITGKKYYQEIAQSVTCSNIEVIEFVEDLFEEFKKTRLLVSRSGATTIAETLGGKAITIFVPSPNVVNNHQYFNAQYYKKIGACELVEEKNIDQELLLTINKILQNEEERIKIKEKMALIPCLDAKYIFANEVIKLIGDCDEN